MCVLHSSNYILNYTLYSNELGKSSFLKALAGQLYIGSNKLDGTITYNGDTSNSGKFHLAKIADYVDEKDQHAATLWVSIVYFIVVVVVVVVILIFVI